MKKHLIAVAVAAAFAAPAMAQVSISGTLGAGFTATSLSVGTADTQGIDSGENGYSTSIIQLSGSEDLGGGLRASFVLQGSLGSYGNVGNRAFTTGDDAMFNRQAYLQLSRAGLGSLRLGRTSDVIDSTEGFANHVNLFDTEAADEEGIGNKNASTVRFDSETLFGGLTFAASYSTDARQTSTATATTLSSHKVTTYGVQWSQGPLTAGFSYGEAALSTSANAPIIDNIYAGYKIGAFDVRVQQVKETTTTAGKTHKTSEVSVAYALGDGLTVIGHYEKHNISNSDNSDYKQLGIIVNKDLSKRTAVFAGYRDRDLVGTLTHTDVSVTTIGLQHKF